MSFSFEMCPKRKLYSQMSCLGTSASSRLGDCRLEATFPPSSRQPWISRFTTWILTRFGDGVWEVIGGKATSRCRPRPGGGGSERGSGAAAWAQPWKGLLCWGCHLCALPSRVPTCLHVTATRGDIRSQSFKKQQTRYLNPDPSLGAAGPQGVYLLCPESRSGHCSSRRYQGRRGHVSREHGRGAETTAPVRAGAQSRSQDQTRDVQVPPRRVGSEPEPCRAQLGKAWDAAHCIVFSQSPLDPGREGGPHLVGPAGQLQPASHCPQARSPPGRSWAPPSVL